MLFCIGQLGAASADTVHSSSTGSYAFPARLLIDVRIPFNNQLEADRLGDTLGKRRVLS
jgi:hypothetical protein